MGSPLQISIQKALYEIMRRSDQRPYYIEVTHSFRYEKSAGENVRKPRFTKRGTRPLCRTKCVKTLKAYQKLYFEFKAKFQEISADLRQAIRQGCDTASISFPLGGVPLFGGRYSPIELNNAST